MATTSIIVNSTNSGKVLQKTITNVNPDAANDKLAAWGQMLTGLTDNTYTKTDRVDKANCDTEDSKQTPTLTLSKTTETLANVKAQLGSGKYGYGVTFTSTSDGVPYAYIEGTQHENHIGAFVAIDINQNLGLNLCCCDSLVGLSTVGFTVHVCLPETDTYKAAEATFTVTA